MAQFGAPNFLKVIDAYEAGADRAERSRLRDLSEQGRALTGKALAGDQNALAQLGGVDLPAYMQVKQLGEAEKKQFLTDFTRAAYAAKTPEQRAALLQSYEAKGHVFDAWEKDPNNWDALVSRGVDLGDQMGLDLRREEAARSQKNADRAYGLDVQQLGETRRMHDAQIANNNGSKAPAGYRYKPDGSMEYIPGGPADPSKPVPTRNMRPTGDQSNAAGFYDRMNASNQIIGGLEKQGTDYWQNFARDYAPGNTAAYFMKPEFQQYDQAQRDFINAQLRKESGAAISPSEFDNARRQYFPQPGDSDAVIKQKAQNRKIAIDAMHRTAGPALQVGPQEAVPQQQGGPEPGVTEDGYRFLGGDPADQNNWEPVQ